MTAAYDEAGIARSRAPMNRNLIALGLAIAAIGFFWGRIRALPLLRLPGDIVIDRPGFKFFFPLTTMLLVSVLASIVMWLWRSR